MHLGFHHHIIINCTHIDEETTIPVDDQHIHYGAGQTETELELEAKNTEGNPEICAVPSSVGSAPPPLCIAAGTPDVLIALPFPST